MSAQAFGGLSLWRSISAASINGPASCGCATSQSRTHADSRKLHCSRLRCAGVSGRPRLAGGLGADCMSGLRGPAGQALEFSDAKGNSHRDLGIAFLVDPKLRPTAGVEIAFPSHEARRAADLECLSDNPPSRVRPAVTIDDDIFAAVDSYVGHIDLLFDGPHRAAHVVNVKQQLQAVKRIVVKHQTVTHWGVA